MSGIAGILHFDGRPVETGQVEAMTAAMYARGPDGIHHWRKGNVALGQCMLRTTPESLEETQPLTNEDESLVLVMDGRVDNYEELRRELLGKGAVLRTRADAELVLRAYEVWGEECTHRVIGECVFFIWDARQQRLFAARDAAGTRHFYYHQGEGWFAFASEIKGLLTLPIEHRLNESRLLDYLVPEFDRDDEVGTLYQGVLRMPAGHAMSTTAAGPRIWRWWNPGMLSEQKFASQQECTDAFMDQLRVAVKCRLRSIKPVGAMLSGGLDSSTIVGLISKEFRGELFAPLRTISMIREDRENCLDWRSIEKILKADPWLQPTIITSGKVDEVWQAHLASLSQADEPFSFSDGFTSGLRYGAARAAGCGVVFDGLAGDLLFYGLDRTASCLVQGRKFGQFPALMEAYRLHGCTDLPNSLFSAAAGQLAPAALRAAVRRRRDEQKLTGPDLRLLRNEVARRYLCSKRSASYVAGKAVKPASDQWAHANNFMGGLISYPHEMLGLQTLAIGIEPRSPFSDRRMIEFAIRMPLGAKLAIPWYKHVLRTGTAGVLPDAVRWRRDIGGNPGWFFGSRLARAIHAGEPAFSDGASCASVLGRWVNMETRNARWERVGRGLGADEEWCLFRLSALSFWLSSRQHAFASDG